MVVSADAILQADATLIVGVIFLATLRQALKLPITVSFYSTLYLAIFAFIASAVGIMNEGVVTISGHDPMNLVGRNCLPIGLVLVACALFLTMRDLKDKQSVAVHQ
jgi:hypothetical protein